MDVNIKKADAEKAYQAADQSGKKMLEALFPDVFKPKMAMPINIRERINGLDDIFDLTKPTQAEIDFVNYNGTSLLIKAAAKFALTALVVKAYNEGKLPDWDNSSEPKWNILFDMTGGRVGAADCVRWLSHSYVGSLLTFLSEENARDAFKKFPEAFEGWVIAKI
jgi:hypothetical protein